MIITTEMQQAIDLIANTRESIYITGKAGTGKTTFLKHIVNHVEKRFVITASTGIAAINASGITLHSLLNIPFGVHDPNSAIKNGINPYKSELLNTIDVLIIDEISMVRPDTMDYIDQKLRIYRNNTETFGGVQVIMFGDLFQLPPVVTKNDHDILKQFYRGPYFFYAHVFRAIGFKVVELTTIFRQSDRRFIEILNNIRSYQMTQDDIDDLECLRNKHISSEYNNKYIHICSYRKDVETINSQLLGEYTHTYYANVSKDFNLNSAPCDRKLMLRTGARVMMLVNDRYQTYCNGSLGEVVALSDNIITIRLDSGATVHVERYEWQACEYKIKDGRIVSEAKGTCRQFPVTLAWAITIHKSQGLTFDNVVIHTKGVFAPGQIYVALSRCTSLDGIVSDTFIDKRHILPDSELLAFEDAYKANDNIFNRVAYKTMRK